MSEYITLVNCTAKLVITLRSDTPILHYLDREGFIKPSIYEDVNNPKSTLSASEKAGLLVTGIKDKVELNPKNYHKLMKHFHQDRRLYGDIADILDEEYRKQGGVPEEVDPPVETCPSQTGVASADVNHKEVTKCNPTQLSDPISRYGQYLEYYYENRKIFQDDKLGKSPSSNFINLAVVHKDEKGMSKNIVENTKSPSKTRIDNIIPEAERFVLLEGPPGIGKSTLCWELCRKWKTVKSLQKYKIVLLLKLRERRVQNSTSLNDIFLHEDQELCQKVVDEVRKREGEGILLVMDGFDEMPPEMASDQDRWITKLIDGTWLPKATRLVSSRPSSLHLLEKHFPLEYRHIEILGFCDDESKVKFAESAFQSEPDILDHFKKFIFLNPVINSLMYLPVNCAIIAKVYKDIRRMGEDLMPKTTTQLYTTLIQVLIRRHLIKIRKWDENSRVPKNLNSLPEDISTDFQRVSELAYKGLFKKDVQLEFTDDDVIAESFHHLGLMKEVKEMYVCEGARTSYSFLHLSIQEFLAAWYVSNHPELSTKVLSGYQMMYPHFEMFSRFLFGIIGPNTSKMLHVPQFDMCGYNTLVLCCLYEAQNPEFVSKFIESSQHNYIDIDHPLDLYVFGYILVHAPVQWTATIATPLDMLVSSLKDHASSHTKISGSISELILLEEISENFELNNLRSCVTEHMTFFYVDPIANSSIPVFSEWIPTLSDLNDVELIYEEPCYLLYQSLQSLTKLRRIVITCFGCSSRGAQELSKVIANSSTLHEVSLKYTKPPCLSSVNNMFQLYSVVEAVLSSSTVTSLETNFPFQISDKTEISSISLKKERLTFHMPLLEMHPLEMQRCYASLRSFAYYSGEIPLKYVIGFDTFLQVSTLRDFTTILINSLNSTTDLSTDFESSDYLKHSSSYRSSLSRALKRDVSVPLSSLRKSQSLDDLRTSPHPCEYYQSCPDLLEMQSLHNMHPKLAKFLDYNTYGNIDFYPLHRDINS